MEKLINTALYHTKTYLVAKWLWGVVHNDGLGEVTAQDSEIFDVVTVDIDTMFSKQPMSAMVDIVLDC